MKKKIKDLRIMDHPVLGKANFGRKIYIILNEKKFPLMKMTQSHLLFMLPE